MGRVNAFTGAAIDEAPEPLDREEGRRVLRRHYRPEDFDGFSLRPATDHMALLMRDVPKALLPKPGGLDESPVRRQRSPEVASEVRREREPRSLARKVGDAVTGRQPGMVDAFGHYGPAGLQFDRETGTVSEAEFGPWVPDVVTSKPPNAFTDPRFAHRRISVGGKEHVRKENLDSGRLAEMIAQRIEAPDLFLTSAERERLAKPDAPRSVAQMIDTGTGLVNGRLFANSAVNTIANLTAAGVRSLGGFGDAQQAALEGRSWVDAGSGKPAEGLGRVGMDNLDWLAMPGSGPIAGLAVRRAERLAGKPADGPALAANQSPDQPSRSFGVTKPKAEPMGPQEILEFVQNYGAENGLPVSRQSVKPPPPGQRRYADEKPSEYLRVEDPARKARLSEEARRGMLNRGADPEAVRERVTVRVSEHPDEPYRAAPNRIDVLRAKNERGEPLTDPDNLRDALDSLITPADNALRLTPPGSRPERTFRPRKFDPFDSDVDVFTPFHHSQLVADVGGRRVSGPDAEIVRDGVRYKPIETPDGRRAWLRMPDPSGKVPEGTPEAPRFLRAGQPVFDAVGRHPRSVWRDVMDWYQGQGRLLANQAGQQERSAMRGLGQDQTPFYGDDVGPKGRIPDPGSEIERLGLGSGLPGRPTTEGFFNPATAALLQAGVAPKNTVAYYRKQLEGRGGRLPPGQWEEVTHGMRPSDVIERDELVRRLDSMAPSIEVRRASLDEHMLYDQKRDELHALMDEALNELPYDGPRNISVIRGLLDEGVGANVPPDLRAKYEAYVRAWDAVNEHGKRPPVEPRWHGYITDGDVPQNYRETALGYREKEPSDWAIERGHDDPRAAQRMERAWDDEADLPPGVDPEEAAMHIARGVADRLGGNVGAYRDKAHMGHLSKDGDGGHGPNLEGWLRTQEAGVPRGDKTERVSIVEEAQDQRRRMVKKQGARKSEAEIEDLRAKEEEALQAAMEVGLDARAFVVSPSAVADVKRFRMTQRSSSDIVGELRDVLQREVDYSKSMNFNRAQVDDLLASRNPDLRQLFMLAHMVRDLPHTTSPAALESINRLVEQARNGNAFNRPDIRRLLEVIDGGADPAKLDHINTLRALVEHNVLQGENLTRAQAIIEANNGRQEVLANARSVRKAAEEGVPSSPYTHSKPAAAGLLARQAVRDASVDGVDRMAWPTGNEQATRFGIGGVATRIAYDPESRSLWFVRRYNQGDGFTKVPEAVTPDKLADYVGADVARQVLASERNNVIARRHGRDYRLGDGHILDLPEGQIFGGKGMRSFYGEGPNDGGLFGGQIQSTLRKLDRSREPSIEPIDVTTAGLEPQFDRQFPSVPLSDKAKQKARDIGVSLYSRGGDDRLRTGVNALRDERSRRPTPNEIIDLHEAGEDLRAIADDARMSLQEVQSIVRRGRQPEASAPEAPETAAPAPPPKEPGTRPDLADKWERRRSERLARIEELVAERDGNITRDEIAEALGVSKQRVYKSGAEVEHGSSVNSQRRREELIAKARAIIAERGNISREELARELGTTGVLLDKLNDRIGRQRIRSPELGDNFKRVRAPEKVAEALELIDQGLSYGKVADRLGLTRNQVAGIVRDNPKGPASFKRDTTLLGTADERAGLVSRFTQAVEQDPGSRPELARRLVVDLYNEGDTIKSAAHRSGLSIEEATRIIADEVEAGGAKPERSPLTRMGLDDEGLERLLREGRGPTDIAREYGVTPDPVAKRAARLRDRTADDVDPIPEGRMGGYRHGQRVEADEAALIVALRRAGVPPSVIRDRLGLAGRHAVKQTLKRLAPGERMPEVPANAKAGTREEIEARDAVLADMRSGDKPMSYGEIAERLGVSRSQVAAYIRDARGRGVKVNAKPGIGARASVVRRQEEGDDDE